MEKLERITLDEATGCLMIQMTGGGVATTFWNGMSGAEVVEELKKFTASLEQDLRTRRSVSAIE